MGLAVGRTTFVTCIWIGRFMEAWESKRKEKAHLISRGDERIVICGAATYIHPETGKRHRVSDSEIRSALIEQFPATGEGKTPQIGTKKKPGPLYNVKGHAWSALSVAYTFAQTHDEQGNLVGSKNGKSKGEEK